MHKLTDKFEGKRWISPSITKTILLISFVTIAFYQKIFEGEMFI